MKQKADQPAVLRLCRLISYTIQIAFLSFAKVQAELPPRPLPQLLPPTASTIEVDGDLGDTGWKDALIIDQFYETWPGNNIEPLLR